MSLTLTQSEFDAVEADVDKASAKYRMWFIIGCTVSLLYLIFCWFQFEISKAVDRWNPERASMFVLDTYAHKDHITMRWKSPEEIQIAFEGGHRHVYEPKPDWFSDQGENGRIINFPNGGIATFFDREITLDWPDELKTYVFQLNADNTPIVVGHPRPAWVNRDTVDEVLASGRWFEGLPQDIKPNTAGPMTGEEWAELRRDLVALGLDQPTDLPKWMRVTNNKIEIRPSLFERIQVGSLKVEAHRYEFGWKYFWFDFDSPLVDVGILSAIGMMFAGERVVPEMSNAALVYTELRDNSIWGHGAVMYAMVETIFMALLGTMIAAVVGLPLAFMAARNVQPVGVVRLALRRLFDVLRGVDTLIWSLIFLRAFGPGLFTGIFAIAFTDTGTLGKLMSEAIENADNKQREGIQSTGAAKVQQHRFGILPQIMPVFVSQSLYYLESNTRGAVIIGAMGAGGIGLQFLGALQTGNDFENVAYMAILVLITVIAMDAMSARLRKALIGYEARAK